MCTLGHTHTHTQFLLKTNKWYYTKNIVLHLTFSPFNGIYWALFHVELPHSFKTALYSAVWTFYCSTSSHNEYLGCFQYFGISNKATLSNFVHQLFCIDASISKDKFLQVELLHLLITVWVSLEAQLVKNLPAMQDTWVRFVGWEDPLEKG